MVNTKGFGISGILAIVVAVLLVSALFPAAISSATSADFSSRHDTVTLNTGESYNLSDTNATMTLDTVNTANATYTFAASGDSATVTIDEGNSTNVTVNGVTYDVTVENLNNTDQTATADVSYQVSNGGLAQEVWILVPIFIVLAPLLLFVSFATDQSDKI